MTHEELLAVAEIVEKLTNRYRDQEAAHKTALAELRASFNARTASYERRLENLREEIIRLNDANGRLVVERDTLREEVAHLKTQLKPQTPKHPVKVGGWVRRTKTGGQSPVGIVKQVTSIRCGGDSYGFADGDFWSVDNCEPCDPPTEATHDTPEGKDVAESVIRDNRSRDINDGDLVEVVSNTGRNTWLADVGSVGTVTSIETINDSISVCLDDVPGKQNALAGYVSLCDVRKVTA